jgi:ABC-type polar amino acid transport system ATPase subunit
VEKMIEIRGLHKNFGELHVLKGIDLKVPKGEVLSVIGASGSGKSTLLYCINGLELIQQGTIHVDGIDIHAKDTDINVVRQNLGMVFQQWNSFPHLTVLENVALSPKIVRKMSQQEANHIAEKQLRHVGLGDKLSSFPSALSGGQQQRLAIARALAMEPSYMLFDEATSALDPELVGEVLDTMRLLAKEGMTMICVTHEMGFAREVSDRVAFFHEGVIDEIESAEEFFTHPKSEHLQKFLSKVK